VFMFSGSLGVFQSPTHGHCGSWLFLLCGKLLPRWKLTFWQTHYPAFLLAFLSINYNEWFRHWPSGHAITAVVRFHVQALLQYAPNCHLWKL
jgi:hypothetical protein